MKLSKYGENYTIYECFVMSIGAFIDGIVSLFCFPFRVHSNYRLDTAKWAARRLMNRS